MKLINLIFPKKCAVCGEFIEGEIFCRVCEAKYEQIKRVPCKKCGSPHSLCRCKPERLKGEKNVICRHLFAFEGEMAKGLIYKLKRKNLSSLQKFFAAELALLIKEELYHGEEYIVSYAPRARKSVREYGFDQAEIIAREAARLLDMQKEKLFERENSANKQQKNLGAKEREENAQGAFSLFEDACVANKAIILIDDVTTTGSTAKRLCELALAAGAKKVIFVCAAKT